MIIRQIKFNIVFLLFLVGFAQSQEPEKRITLNYDKEPLRSVLEELKLQSGINFIYRDDLVDNIFITCKIENSQPENAIKRILKGHSLSFQKFDPNYFILYKEEKKNQDNYTAAVLQNEFSELESGTLSNPVIISKTTAVYPSECVKNKIEGKVEVKLFINKEGSVSRTIVESSSGSAILDSATVEYVQSLKFIPAQTNGKPQNIWVTMHFEYLFEKN